MFRKREKAKTTKGQKAANLVTDGQGGSQQRGEKKQFLDLPVHFLSVTAHARLPRSWSCFAREMFTAFRRDHKGISSDPQVEAGTQGPERTKERQLQAWSIYRRGRGHAPLAPRGHSN